MVTREQIIAEARSWIGTPVAHQGQRRAVAADCKGFIVGVTQALGMPEAASVAALERNYQWGFKGNRLFAGLAATLIRVAEPEPADLLAIMMGRDTSPRHLALLTRPGWIIHAYGGGVGRVAEVPLDYWRVHSAWTWPSLSESDGH